MNEAVGVGQNSGQLNRLILRKASHYTQISSIINLARFSL
jgi:hypothetical protein